MEERGRDYVPYLSAALSGVLLIFGAAGYLFWKDAGELATAAVDMGVPHPTGFPLWTGGARVFGYLPLGSLDFRFSLLSVTPFIGCVWLLSSLVGRVFANLDFKMPLPADICIRGIGLPLLVLSSVTAHYLASTPEVYALACVLVLAQIFALLAVKKGEVRARLSGALLGLAPLTHITAGMGVITVVFARLSMMGSISMATVKKGICDAFIPFVIAFMGVLALIFSAANNPELNFGNPSDLGGLWAHLTGASIQEAFSGPGLKGSVSVNLAAYLDFLFQDLGLVTLGFAALSLPLAKGSLIVRSFWVLFILDGLYSLFLNPMGRVDLQTGMLTVLSVGALACLGLAQISLLIVSRWKSIKTLTLGTSLAVVVLLWARLPQVEATWSDRRALRHDDTPLELMRYGLDRLPTNGVVFTTSDDIISTTIASRRVDGRRPDVRQIITPYAWWPWRIQRLGSPDDLGELYSVTASTHYKGLAPSDEEQRKILKEILRWAHGARSISWEPGSPIFEDLLGNRMSTGIPYGRVEANQKLLIPGIRITRLAENRVAHRWSHEIISNGLRLSATVAARKGETSVAMAWNSLSLKLDPYNGRAWGNLGVLHLRQGRFDESIQAFERALRLRPRDTRVLRNKGIAFRESGQKALARQTWMKALEDVRSDSERQKIQQLLDRLAP